MSEANGAKDWTLGGILDVTAGFLKKKNPESPPRLDAELLLSKVLGIPRVGLYINFDRVLNEEEVSGYRELVRRRGRHEPVAYILGEKEFYKLPLKADPRALIPRPDTEHLVDEALRILRAVPAQDPATAGRRPAVADLGCGSGAIALAIAKEYPLALVEASDISKDALSLAKENALALGLQDKVAFHEGDLFQAPFENARFDLICANLPYVPSGLLPTLPPDVAGFEPWGALDGGPDGMGLTGRLLKESQDRLHPGGHILLEIDPSQLGPLSELASSLGLLPQEPIRDYSKRERVFSAKSPGPGE
ncbi:MAG: peptide chain release factor N(5)-glutamine methyltransferase [Deltaproteobacteria bacterium]|jgi:release factor glutamine methyltransferase|nr:peptide chain release factor N(5)-glutamine methyltransferase [Deltaproteobacteria bacterium]